MDGPSASGQKNSEIAHLPPFPVTHIGKVGRPLKGPSITPLPRPGGRVVFRVLATIQGKQMKKLLPSRDAAELLAAKWRDGQASTLSFLPTRFSPNQLKDAEAAQRMLDGIGIGILDAVLFTLRNYKAGSIQVPALTEAVEQFLSTRISRSISYQKSLRNTLHRFCKFVGKKDLGLVQTEELESWLKKTTVSLRPKTWNTLTENLQSFFSWCTQKGWMLKSPASGIEKKKVRRSMPVVLSPERAAALMADVESTHPCYVPYFALALYGAVRAGIREGECVILSVAKNPVRLRRENSFYPSGFFTSFRMTNRKFL
jgi:hypothetical protein